SEHDTHQHKDKGDGEKDAIIDRDTTSIVIAVGAVVTDAAAIAAHAADDEWPNETAPPGVDLVGRIAARVAVGARGILTMPAPLLLAAPRTVVLILLVIVGPAARTRLVVVLVIVPGTPAFAGRFLDDFQFVYLLACLLTTRGFFDHF